MPKDKTSADELLEEIRKHMPGMSRDEEQTVFVSTCIQYGGEAEALYAFRGGHVHIEKRKPH